MHAIRRWYVFRRNVDILPPECIRRVGCPDLVVRNFDGRFPQFDNTILRVRRQYLIEIRFSIRSGNFFRISRISPAQYSARNNDLVRRKNIVAADIFPGVDIASGFWTVTGLMIATRSMLADGLWPVTGLRVASRLQIAAGFWAVTGLMISPRLMRVDAFWPSTGLRIASRLRLSVGFWAVIGLRGAFRSTDGLSISYRSIMAYGLGIAKVARVASRLAIASAL